MSMSSCPRGCGEEAGRYTAVQRCRARTWHTGCSTCDTTRVRAQRCGKPSSPLPRACQGKSLGSWARSSTDLLGSGHIEQVVEVLVAGPQQGPHRARALVDVVHLALAGTVPQEGPVEAGIRVLHQLHLWHRERTTLRAMGKRRVLSSGDTSSPPLGWLMHCLPWVTSLLSLLPHWAGQGSLKLKGKQHSTDTKPTPLEPNDSLEPSPAFFGKTGINFFPYLFFIQMFQTHISLRYANQTSAAAGI